MVKYRGLMFLFHHKFWQSLRKLKSGFCTDHKTDKSAPKAAQCPTAMTGSFLPALPRQAIPAAHGDNCLTQWDDPQPFGSLCQSFLALNLTILHKANPETSRSVIKSVANYFLFVARQVKEDANQAVLIPKGVLRINQNPEASHTGDFSWNWEQEPTKKTSRTELLIEKGHFFSTLPSPTLYLSCNDSAGRNQVSEGKHSGPEIRSMPKIGEPESTWAAQA